MAKVNWDVLRHTLGGLLVAGGPIAGMLAAMGMNNGQIDQWLGIGTIAVGVLCTVAPIVMNVMTQTDAGKAANIERLDDQSKAAVLSKMAPEAQVALVKAASNAATVQAVNAQPEVKAAILNGH